MLSKMENKNRCQIILEAKHHRQSVVFHTNHCNFASLQNATNVSHCLSVYPGVRVYNLPFFLLFISNSAVPAAPEKFSGGQNLLTSTQNLLKGLLTFVRQLSGFRTISSFLSIKGNRSLNCPRFHISG